MDTLQDIVPKTAKTGNLREALAAQMEIGRTRRRTQTLTSALQRLPVALNGGSGTQCPSGMLTAQSCLLLWNLREVVDLHSCLS
jgi:hypothetical protein